MKINSWMIKEQLTTIIKIICCIYLQLVLGYLVLLDSLSTLSFPVINKVNTKEILWAFKNNLVFSIHLRTISVYINLPSFHQYQVPQSDLFDQSLLWHLLVLGPQLLQVGHLHPKSLEKETLPRVFTENILQGNKMTLLNI